MTDGTDRRRRYELSDGETPANGIYTVVADLEGTDETALPPLGNQIDPGALEELLSSDADTEQVVFKYAGYEVTATSELIQVTEPTE
ncbi:MAG: HalOD1 output domain-containing protein [Halobaculum sp.]